MNAKSTNYQIVEALGAIVRDKQVDHDFLMETVKEGLASAVKRTMRARRNLENVDVEIDNDAGEISVVMVKKVVEEIEEDEYEEILIEEARELEPDIKVGENITIRFPLEHFGRHAIATAKQVIVQRIREAERERIYNHFTERLGDIVTGTVQQISRGNLIVNLGSTEGILRVRDQIRRERYRQGDRVRAMVLEVQRDAKRDPMVVLSRSHPQMLGRLFQMEVPEISEGIVQIRAIAREAGDRAKVAVEAMDETIDAVGACVGIKGSRVLSVAQEFNGEKIDIVPWSDDRETFLHKALQPARVTAVEIDEASEEPKVTVVVKDDQLSLAIGRSGQNARLAAKLTGYRIDIISDTEYREILEEIRRLDIPVGQIESLNENHAQALVGAGYRTLRDLSGISLDLLTEIPEIGAEGAEVVFVSIQEEFQRFEVDEDDVGAGAEEGEAAPTAEDGEGAFEAAAITEGDNAVPEEGSEDSAAIAEEVNESDAVAEEGNEDSAAVAEEVSSEPMEDTESATEE